MNHQRSRSRQRPSNNNNTYRIQQQQVDNQSSYNHPKPTPTDRIIQERSSQLNPKDYNPNSLYPPTYQQGQFRKSPSPIKKPQKQIKPLTTNTIINSCLDFQSNPTYSGMQKHSLRDLNLKKVEKLQQLQSLLKNIKKPFQPGDIPAFQAVMQRLVPKFKFEQIYGVFLYFFIHYSVLDENIYRMFYTIIGKDSTKVDNIREIGNPLMGFYDMLIKSTLKVTFDEFKPLFIKCNKDVKIESYFKISQQQRQKIFNQSLYPSSSSGQVGSSIRNTLTLIRKSMERQKVSGDRSIDAIHPIRQVLKLLKSTIKSLLEKIFLTEQQNIKQHQQNNVFFMIIFSQLSIIIHTKYKHQLTAQCEETLNEMTILKMKLSQMLQEIQNKSSYFNAQKDNIPAKNQQQQTINELKFSYERLKKQHDSNYLYLLFVINLSTYNRNQLIGEGLDSSIFAFFIQPLLEEYRKSSQFLSQKIQENTNKGEKLKFFLQIVKNFGIYYQVFDKEKSENNNVRSKLLQRFVEVSYSNLIVKAIDYMFQATDKNKENIGEKLVSILNSLSYKQSSFKEINELKGIKSRISHLKEPGKMLIQQQESLKQNHLVDQFAFLIDWLIESQLQNVSHERKSIIQYLKNRKNDELSSIKNNSKQCGKSQHQTYITQHPNESKTHTKQSINSLIRLIQSLKQYLFRSPILYCKLLCFFYLMYKNQKHQKVLIFMSQYQQMRKQMMKENKSQEIMDQDDEVIECENKSEQILAKMDKYVLKKVNKIKFISQCQDQLLKSLFQDLKSHKSQLEIFSTLQWIKQSIISKVQNYEQLLIHSCNESFILFMIYEQQSQQRIKIHKSLTEISHDFMIYNEISHRHTNTLSSQFVRQQIQQIEEFYTLVKSYLQLKQSTYSSSSITPIQKLIGDKKAELLSRDIDVKLREILNKIENIYKRCGKVENSSVMIDLEIVVERLLIKLFHLQRERIQLKEKDDFLQRKDDKIRQNQKQSQLRKKLTSKINVTLQQSKQQNNTQQCRHTSRQSILSHILATIYWKFSSSLPQNFNQPLAILTSSLEDILVLKLKKCISLFYDKINDYMLNSFILDKRLFILRCMAITFYKMKQLSETVLNKYGALGKGYETSVSSEMTHFVQDIFFFISNKQALESYLKFIITKDRFFIKTELTKYRSITNNKVDQLIELVDGMGN